MRRQQAEARPKCGEEQTRDVTSRMPSPQRRYRSPHREYAITIQRSSAVEAADKLGQTQDEFLGGLAKHYRGQLRRALRQMRKNRVPPERWPIDYSAWYQRLSDDPRYVLEYRQALIEDGFDATINRLERWLAESPWAQSMIDRAVLQRFAGAGVLSSTTPIWRAFGDAVRSIQVLAPISGGIQASAIEGGIPALEIGGGVFDAFGATSKLVVATSARVGPSNSLGIRDLRQDPPAFARATDELRALLEVATGTRATAPTYVLQGTLADIAGELCEGAEAFVMFHELAHLLLPSCSDPHKEEERCDEFAAYVLCASRSEFIVLGMYMGLMLLAAVLRDTGAFIASDSHPRFGIRMDKVNRLVDAFNVAPSKEADALLAVPSRIMEEAVFRTETRQRIAPNLAISLHDGWKDSPARDHSWPVAQAMMGEAVRLPTLEEDTRRTWWHYEGYRFMLVVVEPLTAISAARRALEAAAPSVSWDRQLVACDAALRLLAFLGRQPDPSAEAIALFASLAAPTSQKRSTKLGSSLAWPYLEKIRAAHRQGASGSISPLVGLEFYVPAHWY